MSGKVREYKLAVHTGCGKSLIDCNCMGDGATTGQVQTAIDKRDVEPLVEALRRQAEELHGLSEDPAHLRHVFKACRHPSCIEARVALKPFEDQEGEQGG